MVDKLLVLSPAGGMALKYDKIAGFVKPSIYLSIYRFIPNMKVESNQRLILAHGTANRNGSRDYQQVFDDILPLHGGSVG